MKKRKTFDWILASLWREFCSSMCRDFAFVLWQKKKPFNTPAKFVFVSARLIINWFYAPARKKAIKKLIANGFFRNDNEENGE
jgi:hypothetical protein